MAIVRVASGHALFYDFNQGNEEAIWPVIAVLHYQFNLFPAAYKLTNEKELREEGEKSQ